MAQRSSPTIYEVAAEADVSIATVSRVLRGTTKVAESTRQRVSAAVRKLGYVPSASAQGLAAKRTEAIGLVLPPLEGPYYADVLMGFAQRAAELNQSVVLHIAPSDSQPLDDVLRLAGRVDGIAFIAQSAADDDLVSAVAARMPVVTVARDETPGAERIAAENTAVAAALTRHLLSHGHRTFAFVGDTLNSPDARRRFEGVAQALTEADVPVPEPIAVRAVETDGAALAREVVHQRTAASPRPPQPPTDPGTTPDLTGVDVFVCVNDLVAIAMLEGLQAGGIRVPDEVAVVGWDDIMATRFCRPGLTTVHQPVAELGGMAAHRLHQRLDGGPPADEALVLPSHLVLRQSCGCPEPAREHDSPQVADQPTERIHLGRKTA